MIPCEIPYLTFIWKPLETTTVYGPHLGSETEAQGFLTETQKLSFRNTNKSYFIRLEIAMFRYKVWCDHGQGKILEGILSLSVTVLAFIIT